MHTFSEAFYLLKNQLLPIYDDRESTAIAHELLNHITSQSKFDRLINKSQLFTTQQQLAFEKATLELLAGKPLQYVIGNAWFMEHEFIVNEHVLIPRPETEELVQWIVADYKDAWELTLLDIGTGSGCIPVSLKLALPQAQITACDISENTLEVAATNATKLNANITFIGIDILDPEQQNNLGSYNVIVSNPPYIPVSERENMHSNVKDHEPGIALFVPSDDALLFYRTIAQLGKSHLEPEGCIYCELESSHGEQSKALFEEMGYKNVEIRKDMHGNWRMLKAVNN